ncbi:hypothetical protein B0I37DRAFT_376723 [Chaetomium sp. MPI-CAGE-AT-0009]|nr:hypothetical protein B0I37DRAFT_376723 [Chaetomium sp. MPI-CAGE-AT-0009]
MRFTVVASWLFATLAVASPISGDSDTKLKSPTDALADFGLGEPLDLDILKRAPGDVQCNRTCPRASNSYLNNCEEAAKKLKNKTFAVETLGMPDSVTHGNCRIRITGMPNAVCKNTDGNIQAHFRAIRDAGCKCGHFKWKKDDRCATVVEKTTL